MGTSIVLGERGNEGNRVYTQQCGWSHLHFWATGTFCNSGIIDRNDYDDEKNLNEQHKHNCPNETDRSAAAPKRDDGRQLFRLKLSAILVLEAGISRRDSRSHRTTTEGETRGRRQSCCSDSFGDLRSYSILPEALPLLLFQGLYG